MNGVVHFIAVCTVVTFIVYKPTQYQYERHISSFHDQRRRSLDVVEQNTDHRCMFEWPRITASHSCSLLSLGRGDIEQ